MGPVHDCTRTAVNSWFLCGSALGHQKPNHVIERIGASLILMDRVRERTTASLNS